MGVSGILWVCREAFKQCLGKAQLDSRVEGWTRQCLSRCFSSQSCNELTNSRLKKCTKLCTCPSKWHYASRNTSNLIKCFALHSLSRASWLALSMIHAPLKRLWTLKWSSLPWQDALSTETILVTNFLTLSHALEGHIAEKLLVLARNYIPRWACSPFSSIFWRSGIPVWSILGWRPCRPNCNLISCRTTGRWLTTKYKFVTTGMHCSLSKTGFHPLTLRSSQAPTALVLSLSLH